MKFSFFILAFLSSIFLNAKPLITSDVLSYYQPNKTINLQTQEVEFWQNRLLQQYENPSFHYKLAQAYSALFDVRRRITDLRKAETHLRKSLQFSAKISSALLRDLAHNLTTQHRFCDALTFLEEAYSLGGDLHLTKMKLFDVYLELGEDALAFEMLQQLRGEKIQYKIRLAKWEDKQGRLSNAIACLESALEDAKYLNDEFMLKWLYSNLGDFYGHAGRLSDSRDAYVTALKYNNADWYALKGLAWIAYSGEYNLELAQSIVRLLDHHCESPTIDIFNLELKEYMDKPNFEMALSVYEEVSNITYGEMYNSFKVDYLLETGDIDNALKIATLELEGRATPQTYAQYAKTLVQKGQNKKALEVYTSEIKNKTFEPGVFLDMIEVTQSSKSDYTFLISELKDSFYELGPVEFRLVEEAIQNIKLQITD